MSAVPASPPVFAGPRAAGHSWPARLGHGLLRLVLAGMTLWVIGAFVYDLPFEALRAPVAIVYGLAVLVVFFLVRDRWLAKGLVAAGFALVLAWWLSLRPSNDRPWLPDVAQTGWAEIDGDQVTLHNVRNCDYRTEMDYTPHWETRIVDLSKLSGIDLAI